MPVKARPLAERFWEKVDVRGPDECWPWLASTNPAGYGRFNVGGSNQIASRVAYELVNGPLGDGMQALHRCDNPPCCNPTHLFEGTNGDNIRDMFAKGRGNRTTQPKGEAHGKARLTAAKVLQMRAMYATGRFTLEDLSATFSTSVSNVHTVVTRQTWTHI